MRPLAARRWIRTSSSPVGTTGAALLQIEAAKAVCAHLSVSRECLQYAIESNQEYGIWGGTTEEERRFMRREFDYARRALAARSRLFPTPPGTGLLVEPFRNDRGAAVPSSDSTRLNSAGHAAERVFVLPEDRPSRARRPRQDAGHLLVHEFVTSPRTPRVPCPTASSRRGTARHSARAEPSGQTQRGHPDSSTMRRAMRSPLRSFWAPRREVSVDDLLGRSAAEG